MSSSTSSMTDDVAAEVVAAARLLGFRPGGSVPAAADMARASGRDPVVAVADACELIARRVVLPPDWFDDDGPPALVHPVDDGEAAFAIAYRRGWRRLRSGAPLTVQEAAGLDRHAVEFLPRLPPEPSTVRGLLRRSMAGTRPDWSALLVTTIVVAFAAFWTPVLLGQLGSSVAGMADHRSSVGAVLALLLLAAALAFWHTIRVTAISRLRTRMIGRITAMLWTRAVHAGLPFHRNLSVSDRQRQVLVGDRISTELNDDVVVRALDATVVVAAIAAVATTTPILTVGVGAALAAEALLLGVFVRGAGRRADRIGEAAGRLQPALGELLHQQTEWRVWRAGHRAALVSWSLLHWLTDTQHALRVRAAAREVIATVWPIVVLAVVVALSSNAEVSFADFITAQTAGILAALALGPAMAAADATLRARAMIGSATPVLMERPEPLGDPLPALQGSVRVDRLSVSLSVDAPPQLQDIDIAVAAGEFVVVTGRVGAGTSTLLRAILGLEVPASGQVLVDDIDVSPVAPQLRRRVGALVQQQTDPLLPGTIRDNVTMGRHISGAAVWNALAAVGAADWVRTLGLSIETATTNEGQRLSTTQRQQILLARALVGDPELLVLDTPVRDLTGPALDQVVEALAAVPVTRIVATRQRRLVAAADRVIVLSSGRIVADGPAERLAASSAEFREVFGD